MTNDVPSALFVGVHNAGRSQMTSAFFTRLGGGHIEVRSASSAPADIVNPAVVRPVAEGGIDIFAEIHKLLTIEAGTSVRSGGHGGCGDVYLSQSKQYLGWKPEIPARQGVDAGYPIHDQIVHCIHAVLAELDDGAAAAGRHCNRGRHPFRQLPVAASSRR
ncbi:phosphotyrosine protein phosphatase [Streptomyces bacillaris]|uniref:phosphotyrosine protein phosphatase n=1 Tax=Streptomyces bacillaris TaxID=68179 RepID=UPI00345F455B